MNGPVGHAWTYLTCKQQAQVAVELQVQHERQRIHIGEVHGPDLVWGGECSARIRFGNDSDQETTLTDSCSVQVSRLSSERCRL